MAKLDIWIPGLYGCTAWFIKEPQSLEPNVVLRQRGIHSIRSPRRRALKEGLDNGNGAD